MTNRIIVLSGLLLALALSLDWMLRQSESVPTPSPSNEPDTYMLNASIMQYDDRGELQHEIKASRFTHFPVTDITAIFLPMISLTEKPGESPWEFRADEGRILTPNGEREQVVELWDNVHATRSGVSGRAVSLRTENLTLYPDRDYAETDAKVHIRSRAGRTTAVGMKAFFNQDRFIFFSRDGDQVVTVLRPRGSAG